MRLVRRTSCFLVWAATLTVSVANVAEVRAEQAQIAGIEKVYLRPSPGTDQTPITVLSAGEQVDILDIEGSWAKVETADGKVGYVYHRYVVPWVAGAPPPAVPRPAAPPAPPAVAAAPGPAPPPPPPPPSPAPTASEAAVSAELAGLRAELAELKDKVQKRAGRSEEASGLAATPFAPDAPGAAASSPAPEQGVGVLAVAFFSLLVGWVLGAAFSRRRSRSQRRRLRF